MKKPTVETTVLFRVTPLEDGDAPCGLLGCDEPAEWEIVATFAGGKKTTTLICGRVVEDTLFNDLLDHCGRIVEADDPPDPPEMQPFPDPITIGDYRR